MLSALLAVTSSALWGGSDFIAGILSRRLGALRVSIWSYSAATIVTISAFLIVPSIPSWPAVWAGLVAALMSAVGFITFYAAMSFAPMGIVSAIVAASQAVVPIVFGPLIKNELISAVGWIGITIAAIGSVLVGGAEGRDGKTSLAAIVLSIVSGITFAFAVVALDWAPASAGMTAPAVEMFGGLVTVVLMLLVTSHIPSINAWAARLQMISSEPNSSPLITQNLVSGAMQGLANISLMFALWSGSLTIVGVIVCLYPVATTILAWRFLGEKLRPLHVLGIVLALAGCVILGLA